MHQVHDSLYVQSFTLPLCSLPSFRCCQHYALMLLILWSLEYLIPPFSNLQWISNTEPINLAVSNQASRVAPTSTWCFSSSISTDASCNLLQTSSELKAMEYVVGYATSSSTLNIIKSQALWTPCMFAKFLHNLTHILHMEGLT